MVEKLVGDRVLVELEPKVDKIGGIYIPEEQKTYKGTLRMVGSECTEPALKVGMIAYFTKYAGTDLKMNGKPHAIMRTEDIVAVEMNNASKKEN